MTFVIPYCSSVVTVSLKSSHKERAVDYFFPSTMHSSSSGTSGTMKSYSRDDIYVSQFGMISQCMISSVLGSYKQVVVGNQG